MDPEGSLPRSQQPATYARSSRTPKPSFLTVYFNTVILSVRGLPSGLFASHFSTEFLYEFVPCMLRALPISFFYFVIVILHGEEYKLCNGCDFPYFSVTLSLLGSNILFSGALTPLSF
jgi:hypothetical protein